MNHIQKFPLYLAYVIFPVVMIISRELNYDISRNWLDAAWVFYAMFLMGYALVSMRLYISMKEMVWLGMLFFVAIFSLNKWVFGLVYGDFSYIPYLMELKPVIYLVIGLFIYLVTKKIDNADYIVMGAILGALVIAEFGIKSALSGEFVLPRISGERNYDALLLLVSFVMLFQDGKKVSTVLKILIIAGLLLTFSRTALLALVFIVFFIARVPVSVKLAAAALATIFFISSFIIRDLPIDALQRMDRYWMWVTAFQVFDKPLHNLLFGFEVGKNIDVTVPSQIKGLWDMQSEGYGISGIYPFHFHAFWIRFGLTFGLVVAFIFVIYLIKNLFERDNYVLRGLSAIILIEGMTMGVFYLGNIAIPLLLAFLSNIHGKRAAIYKIIDINENVNIGGYKKSVDAHLE